MTKKEIIEGIRALVKQAFGSEESQTQSEAATAEDSATTSEQTEESKETTATENQSAEGEAQAAEVALADEAAAPDMAAMEAEIKTLREQVSAMQELVWLKDENERLKKMLSGFASLEQVITQTLALVEQIADEPTGEPAQAPKNSVMQFGKKKNNILEQYAKTKTN